MCPTMSSIIKIPSDNEKWLAGSNSHIWGTVGSTFSFREQAGEHSPFGDSFLFHPGQRWQSPAQIWAPHLSASPGEQSFGGRPSAQRRKGSNRATTALSASEERLAVTTPGGVSQVPRAPACPTEHAQWGSGHRCLSAGPCWGGWTAPWCPHFPPEWRVLPSTPAFSCTLGAPVRNTAPGGLWPSSCAVEVTQARAASHEPWS